MGWYQTYFFFFANLTPFRARFDLNGRPLPLVFWTTLNTYRYYYVNTFKYLCLGIINFLSQRKVGLFEDMSVNSNDAHLNNFGIILSNNQQAQSEILRNSCFFLADPLKKIENQDSRQQKRQVMMHAAKISYVLCNC